MAVADWATATGSSVVSGLTATDAEWQENTTITNVDYGIVQFTFSGSPTLSAVLAGHYLTVSGFTETKFNGTWLIHEDADNTNKTITARIVGVTSASTDETGASASASVADAGAIVSAPSQAKQEQGFINGEKPSTAWINWLFKEQNTLITANTLRGGYARVDTNIITSTSFADLDSALENFGYFYYDPDVDWAASANDGAYEDVGITVNMTTNTDAQTLLLLTGNSSNSTDGPFDPRIKADGVVTNTFQTAPYAAVETFTQLTNTFCFSALLDDDGNIEYTVEAKRRTNNDGTELRLHAIDVPDLDESDVALIRDTSSLTETSNSTTSFVDITGATMTDTFTHDNALVLFGNSIEENGTTATTNMSRSYRLLRDATTIFDLDTNAGGSKMYKGGHDQQARLMSVTGAHTIKMQGRRSGGSGTLHFAANDNGYFTVIELPDAWDGDTLVRESAAVDDALVNTDTTWTTKGTITDASCNGHPMLLGVSGHFYSSGTGIDVQYRFLVDDVPVGDVFTTRCDSNDSSRYTSPMVLLDDLAAGTHTFKAQVWKNGGVGHYFYDCQFFAVEFPKIPEPTVTPAALTLTSTTGKKVQLHHRGTVTATENSTLTLRATADGSAVGNEEAYSLTADTPAKIDFLTVADAETAGSDVEYKIQAKIDTGRANSPPADMIVQELPGT